MNYGNMSCILLLLSVHIQENLEDELVKEALEKVSFKTVQLKEYSQIIISCNYGNVCRVCSVLYVMIDLMILFSSGS